MHLWLQRWQLPGKLSPSQYRLCSLPNHSVFSKSPRSSPSPQSRLGCNHFVSFQVFVVRHDCCDWNLPERPQQTEQNVIQRFGNKNSSVVRPQSKFLPVPRGGEANATYRLIVSPPSSEHQCCLHDLKNLCSCELTYYFSRRYFRTQLDTQFEIAANKIWSKFIVLFPCINKLFKKTLRCFIFSVLDHFWGCDACRIPVNKHTWDSSQNSKRFFASLGSLYCHHQGYLPRSES